MFSIPLATDQTPRHFLQVLGSGTAPERVFISSTGCSGAAVKLATTGMDFEGGFLALCKNWFIVPFFSGWMDFFFPP